MRKLFSYFVLLAAGLLVGTSAWSEETVYTISSQDDAQSKVEAWLADEGDAKLVVGSNASVSFANSQIISTGIKTINLNGHELTWTNTWAEADLKENNVVVATGQYVINITTGTLKIKDQASGGKLSMISSYDYGWTYGIYLNNADGKFVMESGQISYAKATTPEYVSRITPLCVYGKGTVDISGGSIEMKNNNSYGAYLSGTFEQFTNLDIHCAEGFSSPASSIYAVYANVNNTASLTMDNCSFDLSRVTSANNTYALSFTGSNATATIQNSTFTASSNGSKRYSVYNSGAKVYIESGTFEGDVNSITSIAGGTFSTTIPEKMIASGYVCVPQNDKFIVRAATNAEKVIKLEYPKETPTTTEYYASLYHAVAAAEAALGSKATDYKLTINSNYSYSSWPYIYGTLIVPAGIELTGDASATIYGTLENYGTINCPITTSTGGRINNYTGAIMSVGGCAISKDAILTNDGTLNIGGSASISGATATKSGDVYVKSASAGKLENNGTINIAANAKITVSKKSGYALQCEECEDAIFVNNGSVYGTDNTSKLALQVPASGTGIGTGYGQIPAVANTYAWVSSTNYWEIAGNVINVTTHVGYDQLSDAISYANANDELKLMANGNASGQNIEKAVTIDLNGHTISAGYTAVSDRGQAFTIKENGVLTIKDGSATAPASLDENGNLVYDGGKITAAFGNGTILVRNGGVLNLQGGIIEQTNTDNQTTYAAIEITNTSNRSQGAVDAQVNISGGAVKAGQVGIMIYGTGSTTNITEHAPQINISSGVIMGERGYAICGLGTQGFWDTKINIDGGYVYSKEAPAIYNPQYGQINITNGTIKGYHSAIEIRAGELNMTGGKVICSYEATESESVGNGSGTTTVGAAIAVSQHGTKQPITVTITDGDFEGIIPVKLANPENNAAEYINQVNVAINGGRYKVTNGASAPFWSITDNFAVSAGKFSHVPAYVVAGKTVVPNTGGDKDIYPWTIGEVNETPVAPQGTDITWQTGTDWPEGKVPTSQESVTLGEGQNVVVSGSSDKVAQAYSITIPTGSTLTVESGATLVIGGGGITNEGGESNNGLKVEPGAQVIVSPDADMTGLYGRVAFTPNVGKYAPEDVGKWYSKPNRYQLMGVPTKGVPAVTKNKEDGDGFKLNQWDVMDGWKAATISDFEPFKGFFFWNDVLVNDAAPNLVTYYFKGELFGNKPQTLVFTENEGFHLFANSYLAEVDILALIQGAENNVQKAVYVYDPVAEKFMDISYATYGKQGVPTAIQPMEGFYFLNQHNGTTTAPMDYVSMVWSNAFKVEQEIVSTSAPARQQSEQMTEVRVSLTDNIKGRNDGVYLMERDEVNENANIRKMMNPATSVNVFVANEKGNLSQMQSADLDGQELTITTNAAPTYTFSFEWVQGEEYYLNDVVTGASTCMSEGNTYTFTAQPNSTIEGRFFISRNNSGSVVTDMPSVKTHHAAEGIYTVMGQFMGKTAAWKSLPQGVYVVNGVKMVK